MMLSSKIRKPQKSTSTGLGPLGRRKFREIGSYDIGNVPAHMHYSKDGDHLFFVDDNLLYMISKSGPIQKMKTASSQSTIRSVSVRHDSKLLAVLFEHGTVDILDISHRKTISSFKIPFDSIIDLSFNDPSSGGGSSLSCFSSHSFSKVDFFGNVLDGHEFDFIVSHVRRADTNTFVLSSNRSFYIFDSISKQLTKTWESDVDIMMFECKVGRIYAVDSSFAISVFDNVSRAVVSRTRPHVKTITSLEVSDDGLYMFTGSLDGLLSMTDIIDSQTVVVFVATGPIVCSSRLSDHRFAIGTSTCHIGIISNLRSDRHPSSSSSSSKSTSDIPTNHSMLKLIRSFRYVQALSTFAHHSSTDELINCIVLIHHSGCLGQSIQSLTSSDRIVLLEKLCRIVGSRPCNHSLLLALYHLSLACSGDHVSLLLLREALQDTASVGSVLLSIEGEITSQK